MQKNVAARVKAAVDDSGEGVVEALVATYDTDSIGDRIVPGAFDATLKEWADSGTSIPFIWSHMHDDVDAYLGDVIEASETDEGLYVKAQLDMEDERARKVYRMLKGGRVRNYSFAYEVRDSEEKDGENLLKDIRLFEVGPTLIGMNQNTRTLVVKTGDGVGAAVATAVAAKRGAEFSAANRKSLRASYDAAVATVDLLKALVDRLDPEDDAPADDGGSDDEGKSAPGSNAQPEEPAKREEPAGAKREEPTPAGPADDDLALEIELASASSYITHTKEGI